MAKNFTDCIKITDPKLLQEHPCDLEATDTYFPLPHYDFYRFAKHSLTNVGVGLKSIEFGLTLDSSRLFMWAETDVMIKGMPLYIGGRNSYDKTMSAGYCVGTNIMVCSNKVLASYKNGGVVAKKHTSSENIKSLEFMLESLVTDTVSQGEDTNLCTFFHQLELLKQRAITLQEVKALLMDLYLTKWNAVGSGLQASNLPLIYNEFLNPRHEEFKERTAYNFVMACTEIFKRHTAVRYQVLAYDTLARLMHL